MTKNGTLVEVKNLKKYFNTKRGLLHAVDDVDFCFKPSLHRQERCAVPYKSAFVSML